MNHKKVNDCYDKLRKLNGDEMEELLLKIPLDARLSLVTVGICIIHEEFYDAFSKCEH